MGIFGALTTAVGGLRAQSYALENVSGNIANSQTTAFKRIDTSFLDLIPQTSSDRAARRRRDHAIPLHQLGAGRRADGLGRDLHGDQRQRLLRGAKARQLHRRHAGVRRRRPLHPPRRLPDRQERLSRQRRRLLSAGRSDRSDHRQPCPAVRRRCCRFQNDFLPAQETTRIELSRQPRQLSADDQA